MSLWDSQSLMMSEAMTGDRVGASTACRAAPNIELRSCVEYGWCCTLPSIQ
jgi:hypothetical protein